MVMYCTRATLHTTCITFRSIPHCPRAHGSTAIRLSGSTTCCCPHQRASRFSAARAMRDHNLPVKSCCRYQPSTYNFDVPLLRPTHARTRLLCAFDTHHKRHARLPRAAATAPHQPPDSSRRPIVLVLGSCTCSLVLVDHLLVGWGFSVHCCCTVVQLVRHLLSVFFGWCL